MSRLSLLLRRMDCEGRLALEMAHNEDYYTCNYEWEAEKLTHVECHGLLEAHLRLLDEFDEESHSKEDDEEESEDFASLHLLDSVFIAPHQEETQQDIAECLIQLCRMLRESFASELEYESPWEVSHVTVYLRVEEVAKTDQRTCKAYRDDEPVHDPEEVEVVFLAITVREPPHSEEERYRSAVARESSFPRHEYLEEALPTAKVVVRLIEEAMAEACTDDGCDQKRVEKRVEESLRDLFPVEETLEDEPAEDESADEKYGVPAQCESAETEYLRVHVPMYSKNVNHNQIQLLPER